MDAKSGPVGAVEAVIVLGAALIAPGVPGPALRRRIVHGVKVFRRSGASYLVVSGGVVGPLPAEAEVMRAMALDLGVWDEHIIVEDQARNTFENVVYTGRIIRKRGWRRVIVVTDPFHMPRALFVFRKLGLKVQGDAVPERDRLGRLTWYLNYLREARALVWSAFLFLIGAHKPVVEKVWRG